MYQTGTRRPEKEKQVKQRSREEVKNDFKKMKEIKGKNENRSIKEKHCHDPHW